MLQKDENLCYPLRLPFEIIKGEQRQQESRIALEQAILAYFEQDNTQNDNSLQTAGLKVEPKPAKIIPESVSPLNGHPIEVKKEEKLGSADFLSALPLRAPPEQENPVIFEVAEQEAGDQAFKKAKGHQQKELRDEEHQLDLEAEEHHDEATRGLVGSPAGSQTRNTPRFIGGDKIRRDDFEEAPKTEGENAKPQLQGPVIPEALKSELFSKPDHEFAKLPLIGKKKENTSQTKPAREFDRQEQNEFVDLFKLNRNSSVSQMQQAIPQPIVQDPNKQMGSGAISEAQGSGQLPSLGLFDMFATRNTVNIPAESKMPIMQTKPSKVLKFKTFLLQACVRLSKTF